MTDIDQIKQEIANHKTTIENFAKLSKLYANPEFQEVILNGFCKEQVIASLQVANNSAYPDNIRTAAREMANAGSLLQLWFDNLKQRADMANAGLEEAQNALTEAMKESE